MCKYGTFNKQNLPELRNPLKLEKQTLAIVSDILTS